MIEWFHRSLESSIWARLAGSDWVHHLPLVMLSLLSSTKDDSVSLLLRLSMDLLNQSPSTRWDKSDSVSVDRLKPVISSVPVTPAVPPPHGWSRLVPAYVTKPSNPAHLQLKKVRFSVPVPATQLHLNPPWMVQGFQPLSAVLHPHLLGGVTVATSMTFVQPPKYRALLYPSAALRRPSWLKTQVSFSSIN